MTESATTKSSLSPSSLVASATVDDDLDDLDDVLEELSNPKKPDSTTTASVTTTKESKEETYELDINNGLDDLLSQDFAKEFASGMEALMKELGPTSTTTDTGTENEEEKELMKQFEAMMSSLTGVSPSIDSSSSTTTTAKATTTTTAPSEEKPANFQDAIRATMQKLQQSDASASQATEESPFNDDEMSKLLAALGGSNNDDDDDDDGQEESPELSKMLQGMMGELMSKEILYEPLKELKDKYPSYLDGACISQQDRKRFQDQYRYVSEIVDLFESPSYDPKQSSSQLKIQDLMNQMQDCGSPPKEIVGDMPTELENFPGFSDQNSECTVM